MSDSFPRIDKFLWAIRVFKTRSLAAEACRKGRVFVNDQEVKAARILKLGDRIAVRKNPITYTYEVKELLQNRVGAALVFRYVTDLTPDEEKEKLLVASQSQFFYRPKGQGRPTKKDRRDIDRIVDLD